jgi:uncharacterized membrane protein SpoIIM required for sporulation
MTQQSFLSRRQKFWDEFEHELKGRKDGVKLKASSFPQNYRLLTQDLNTARANGFDPSIIERLNALVLEGNQLLYANPPLSPGAFANFLLRSFPRAVRSQWRSFGAAFLIFYGLGFITAILCVQNPQAVYLFVGEDTIAGLERMYDPGSPYFLEPRDTSSDADMFGFYVYNNISIAFRTFAGGILAGFGSLLFLSVNGVFLGAAAAHIINTGFGETFFPFVIAHSSFELTAIILAAQAGFILGFRFFFTKGLTRAASIKIAGKTALPIISGAALLLLAAACIEAFWSSRHEFSLLLRYSSGGLSWLFVILYLTLAGRRKS